MTSTGTRYLTEIHGVRELNLCGVADATFWRDRLRGEHCYPWLADGCAELLISATAMRWMGVPFRELTFSVSVSEHEDGRSHDGYLGIFA